MTFKTLLSLSSGPGARSHKVTCPSCNSSDEAEVDAATGTGGPILPFFAHVVYCKGTCIHAYDLNVSFGKVNCTIVKRRMNASSGTEEVRYHPNFVKRTAIGILAC